MNFVCSIDIVCPEMGWKFLPKVARMISLVFSLGTKMTSLDAMYFISKIDY